MPFSVAKHAVYASCHCPSFLYSFDNVYIRFPPKSLEIKKISFNFANGHNNTCNYGEKIDPLGHICIAKVNCWRPGIKIKDIIIDISTYFWGASTQNPLSLDMNNLFKNNIELFRKCHF